MSSSIVLKVVFNGSAHRFTLTKPSMSDLIAQLKLSYPNLPADALIKYEDDEQELITISTDNELMEAFNVAVAQGSRTLKLIVSTNNSSAAASPVTPTPSSSIVEDTKVASTVASRATSPAPVRAVPAPKPVAAATATPSPKPAAAAAPATPKPAAAAGEEHKLPGHDEIVELLLSLLKNTEFQAVLPQVLNAVLDELSKPQRSVQALVDRVLQFAAVRDHACTRRLLPFVDQVAPCADTCLSRLNPGLVALARPFVPMAATLLPHAVAFLERLKAGVVECPLADVSGLLSGLGPCGLAGLAKMCGAPRTTAEGDVEFDLGAIPLPPFLASFLSGLAGGGGAREGGCPRARSQPRGPAARGPCERGPCHADPRSQSVPRGGGCRRGYEGPRPHGHHGGRHPHPHPHPHHGAFGPHGGPFPGPHGFPRGPCGPFAGPCGPFPGPHGFPHGPCGPFGGEGRCPRDRSAEMPASPAAEGEPHVWRNFACDGCNMLPITGIRYHCTICKDYDLCEACEAKGVHPRHHPLIKLHVPRPPPSDEQAVHHGVTCDMCHESPITGLRYKCTVCPDFDMCEKCEAKRLHPAEHPVIKLRTERHLPPHLPPFFQGEAAAAGSPRQCPRRGGGGGRYRRFMASTAAAAAAAASATAAAAAAASSSSSACPETKEVPAACGPQQCGPCGPCGFEAPEATPSPIVLKGPQAVLLRHVTLAHGAKLEQGQVLVKTWSVQNNGQEAWPATTKLIFLRGDRELLGETEEFSVLSAQPGQTVEISVPITTPTKAGNYTAYFQLSDQDRNVFGPRLWLEVMVTRDEEDERKMAPVPVSSLSLVSASAPAVDTSGWVDVKVETSPVIKPIVAAPASVPAASLPAPVSTPAPAPASAPVKPVAVAPSAPAASAPPAKYAAQLASLSSMGFNNAELNAFLLEKHNGDIQQVTNWLLENMNH